MADVASPVRSGTRVVFTRPGGAEMAGQTWGHPYTDTVGEEVVQVHLDDGRSAAVPVERLRTENTS